MNSTFEEASRRLPARATWRDRHGRGWPFWLAGGLAGLMQAAAFAPVVAHATPWGPALLEIIAMAALVCWLHKARGPWQAGLAAWGFGTVWLLGGTGWMYVSLHQFGGLPSWLAALAVLALCGALSLYLALAGAAWSRWRVRHWGLDALLFGALWLLAEVARALILTGFPWAASAYALIGSPAEALAPWLGAYGMGQVLATVVALVVLPICLGRGLKPALALIAVGLAGLAALHAAPGTFARPFGKALEVTLLQGNVPQDQKFVPEHQGPALAWYTRQLVAARGDLVVAPETAVPLLPADLPEGFWPALLQQFHGTDRAALIGIPLGSFSQGYTNSVVGISSHTRTLEGGVYRYNKHHLVPFGEVIPWGFRWFVDMMNMPLGDFTRGPRNAPSFQVAGQWVAPNICYEDLFGEELAARFVSGQTPAPTILANVSNLAWFGEQVAIHQHLQIARLRSLEFQRPSIRATNTGATVVIDHLGQVTHSLAPNTRGVLTATVQGMSGLTPYARWAGAWGLWPLIVLAAAIIVGVARGRASSLLK